MAQEPAQEAAQPDLQGTAVPGRITVLSGGVGGARFVQGVWRLIERAGATGTEVTVVANTGDDLWLHGLKVCPDLDTLMYTLGGGSDTERGWGLSGETWRVGEELAAYGAEPTWFGLGDRDLATHIVRTEMLGAGYPLSQVTEALCQRWFERYDGRLRLLPMTDDRTETHVVVTDPEDGERRAVHFQEYWVRHHAQVPVHAVTVIGLTEAKPGPGVVEALTETDLVLVPPSNPVVSVGPVLDLPGVREALASSSAPVVGVSGIIGGDHVHGMARQLLSAEGTEVSAAGVAGRYGARSAGGVLDGWLVAEEDHALVPAIEALGMAVAARPLLMRDPDATAHIVAAAIELAGLDR